MSLSFDSTSLVQQLSTISAESFGDDANARAALLVEAQSLVRRLEDPFDAIKRMTFREPTLICCLLIADRVRLFEALGPAANPDRTITELAQELGAEEDLVRRVSRHLAAHEILSNAPGDRYGPTSLSAVLENPKNRVGFREVANRYMPIFAQAPSWFEERGFVCPRDAKDAVFQKAFDNPGQTFFDWLQLPEHKHASDEFGALMELGVHGSRSWLDVCDVRPSISTWNGNSALLVDVGGSLGQDVREFRRRYPEAKGELVVQDLPATIELAEKQKQKQEDIVYQPHDAFKEQPVKGAKIYFMGSILHDWPESDAQLILRNLVQAMTPGYSTLYLSELVLPDVHCPPQISAIDICMMVELGAKERTVSDWDHLLASAGLKLVNVFSIPTTDRSVIQAEMI